MTFARSAIYWCDMKEEQPSLRIRKANAHNWVIERWQAGGEAISRGRYAGQEKQEKWDTINPVGYFPKLKHAAVRLLDEELKNLWPEDGWTGQDLSGIIAAAEERVMAAVAAIGEDDAE